MNPRSLKSKSASGSQKRKLKSKPRKKPSSKRLGTNRVRRAGADHQRTQIMLALGDREAGTRLIISGPYVDCITSKGTKSDLEDCLKNILYFMSVCSRWDGKTLLKDLVNVCRAR